MKFINAKYPFFLLLLPLFFFLHAVIDYLNSKILIEAFVLFLFYCGISLLLTTLFWLLFKNLVKASLATFTIMAYNFFFGSAYDFIMSQFGHTFFIRFSFILPVTVLLIILLIIYLKKSRQTFLNICKYLNILLIVLILIDTVTILLKTINYKGNHVENLSGKFINCDTCKKPDIYFIITDEYAGKTALNDLFSYDNSGFEDKLQSRGFHIINNSASNYNATVYSMGSLLNMDYIKNLRMPEKINHPDMLICRQLIDYNNLAEFLKEMGYSIYNYSFFEFGSKKKSFHNPFFPSNKSLLTNQTFVERILYHFGARIISKEKVTALKKNNMYNDIKIEDLTRKLVLTKEDQPRFIYTHLKKPHHPYYFDIDGNEIPADSLTDEFTMNRKAYIEYLQYSNRKILGLIDFIRKYSAKPPVIILMGDHGFRQLAEDVDKKYWFINLNAVFFPEGNYTSFYDGMTNVNQFRVILNSLFGQQLPLLKDSTSFLFE